MIFDSRSNYMLKYEKSKSKLVEFNVEEKDYPKFPLNPDDLTYTTLFALSRYCEEIIENPSTPQLPELKAELTAVSQYYDSTVKTQLRQEYSMLFLLLGSTAYFLSENFGSAKVLIEQIDEWILKDSVMTLLYTTLRFLLAGEWMEVPTKRKSYRQYLDSLKSHFETGDSPETIFDALRRMRSRIYQSTNVTAVSYIDFLFSVIICSVDHSAWILLPEYSHAKFEQWKDYLSKSDSVKLLWPAQKAILQAGALTGNDLVVPLPTGVGKTKSIEILLRAKFMDRGTCIAIIIAPLRALCNEITADLTSALADEAVINQFTDTTQEDFDLELLFNTKYVFICTPEKFSYIHRHEPDFLASIQFFLFDEAHLFDDTSRGAQYELLVSEIAKSRNDSAQMVLFSAVLSNANQISEWLFDDEMATIDYSLVKSTEKSIGFLSSDQTIHYYEKDDMAEESFYVPKSIAFTQLQLRGKETKQRIFPEKKAQDIAIYYANKLCSQGGAAIYAGQVRSIPPIMRRIVEISERGYDLSNLLINGNPNEVVKLSNLFALHYGENFELTQASKLGVLPHYANLPTGIKMATEHALRKRHVSFVVCTTTLAEGVNIPIKYLFLTTFSLGNTSVQIRKMQNLVGRTARSGIHTEGSAIITDFKFYDKRLEWRGGGTYKWADCKKMFDYGNTEACLSAILSLVSSLQIDYKSHYKGSALISYLIENYNKPSCFPTLISTIQEGYRKHVSDERRYDRYSPEIELKITQLEHVVESIENYLCYIYNLQQNPDQFFDSVETLVAQTFAYYLGDEEQKKALRKIFHLIAQKIVSDVKPEKAAYFARSLYGIDISKQILNWVDEKIENLKDCSTAQLLEAMANLFMQLFHDKAKVDIDELIAVSRLWVAGEPYVKIYNDLKEILQISQIEKLCSNTLSYHLCFLIGNILDAVGDRADELAEKLAILQKKIKYGVPSRFQILVCENIFDDRIIAKQLDELIGQTLTTDKEFKNYMTIKRNEILQILKSYPDYFSYKFRMYVR
ncbi:MAG: DEAD/DEAH box helicase [Bacillota bacterium]|nr:DEAD/DEAH box helicase [Bacillota bacterium]